MKDKPLYKIFQNKEKTVFFVSDTHFCHAKSFIYEKRGFKTIGEHDEALIANWNAAVRPTDLVFHLGDFMLNGTVERCKETIKRLNGQIYYITGNHNSCIRDIYRGLVDPIDGNGDFYPISWEGKLMFLGPQVEIAVDGQEITLSHFPLRSWNHQRYGAWNLCGHEHHQMVDTLVETTDCGKILDVGVDEWLRPVSFDEVKTYMDKKPVFRAGHH
jgi:calcineurin-like phosphoesterase family protein